MAKGGTIVLLHGIVKKSKKTPIQDLELAEKRMKDSEQQLEKEKNEKEEERS